MNSAAHLLNFLTSTHTHDFGNHNNGYDHLKTTFVRSSLNRRKSQSSISLSFNMIPDSGEIYDF
jgi:hypothetical protein